MNYKRIKLIHRSNQATEGTTFRYQILNTKVFKSYAFDNRFEHKYFYDEFHLNTIVAQLFTKVILSDFGLSVKTRRNNKSTVSFFS